MVPPPASRTDQLTAWLATPVTVAAKTWVFPGSTAAISGATETTTVGELGLFSQAAERVRTAARLATRRVFRDIRRLYPDSPCGNLPHRESVAGWSFGGS